jgi:hypothetical protein
MMRVAFIKDHMEHKAGTETFIPRPLGQTLCYQEILVPWSERLKSKAFLALQNPEPEPIKKRATRKKATSKKASTRSKAVTQTDPAP